VDRPRQEASAQSRCTSARQSAPQLEIVFPCGPHMINKTDHLHMPACVHARSETSGMMVVWCARLFLDTTPHSLEPTCGTRSSNTATSRAREKEVKTAVDIGDEGGGEDRGRAIAGIDIAVGRGDARSAHAGYATSIAAGLSTPVGMLQLRMSPWPWRGGHSLQAGSQASRAPDPRPVRGKPAFRRPPSCDRATLRCEDGEWGSQHAARPGSRAPLQPLCAAARCE
jgi:hypothetical protein